MDVSVPDGWRLLPEAFRSPPPYVVIDGLGRPVARCWDASQGLLIAAAPDLLAVVRALSEWNYGWESDFLSIIEAAQKARDKATKT